MAHGTGFINALWMLIGIWIGIFLAQVAHPTGPCECSEQSASTVMLAPQPI